jgi:hypothetical protein
MRTREIHLIEKKGRKYIKNQSMSLPEFIAEHVMMAIYKKNESRKYTWIQKVIGVDKIVGEVLSMVHMTMFKVANDLIDMDKEGKKK